MNVLDLRDIEACADAVLDGGASKSFIPHEPWAKQKAFLALDVLEAGYGGAAGGGKSDAILMDALQNVHVPGYSALLLRRTYPDLALPGALMDRSHKWLDGTRAVWNEQKKQWTFPTPCGRTSTVQFGYCDTEADLRRYKSAEFQFIGIDEATEWPEKWYTFLFSRLRRVKGFPVPIKMRSGTNPDGPGYGWYRERFGIPENKAFNDPIWSGPKRVFFPARAEDNPALDLEQYELSLEEMLGGRKGVKWKQLREGLWIPDGSGLVYIFDPKKNTAPRIDWKSDRKRWTFVLGIDYGLTNACGFAVIGWRQGDPRVYVLESFRVEDIEPTAAAKVVQELERTYQFAKIVGDVGGLGKGYAEEGRRRWTLPIEPAQKQNKRGYQLLFQDALSNSRILLVPETTGDLRDEWKVLPWDADRKAEAKGFANHAADATLYAWREAPNYHDLEQAPKTEAEQAAAHEAEIEAAAEDEYVRSENEEWWAA
ncbi:Phage terminase, large subunit [Labilithrix luteola]|uniref:Phage terminase, large subunit n=1 Tax=Labilithrix luteola TaxID=1391654 RepID=A0A0K1PUG4_9BACT|nr:terminase family protein [Labilithrix luteola]AKU97011.1 Phage terminase, large subunit [Labilithrix luteola]